MFHWEEATEGDARSLVTTEAVFARARAAYLDRCVVLAAFLDKEGAEVRLAADPPSNLGPDGVLDAEAALVGVSVVEVRRSSFDMAVRIRPTGGRPDDKDEEPVTIRRTLVLERSASGERLGVPREVRDEFIALQLAARGLC